MSVKRSYSSNTYRGRTYNTANRDRRGFVRHYQQGSDGQYYSQSFMRKPQAPRPVSTWAGRAVGRAVGYALGGKSYAKITYNTERQITKIYAYRFISSGKQTLILTPNGENDDKFIGFEGKIQDPDSGARTVEAKYYVNSRKAYVTDFNLVVDVAKKTFYSN